MTKNELHTMEQIATTSSYGVSGATVYFGLTVDEWGVLGVIVGIALGVLTFAFNAWFKMRYLRPKK